jgi:hypothetical protein
MPLIAYIWNSEEYISKYIKNKYMLTEMQIIKKSKLDK